MPRSAKPELTEQHFSQHWKAWKKELGRHHEIVELSEYFAFRKGVPILRTSVSRFLNLPTMPTRAEGLLNLYTMLGAAHYRGLIKDEQQFINYLKAWGISTNPEPQRVWKQITEGVSRYKAEHPAREDGRKRPRAASQPVAPADSASAPAPVQAADPAPGSRQRGNWMLWSVLVLAALLLIVVLLQRASVQSAAIALNNQMQSTALVVLGGMPTLWSTLAPGNILATGTAIAATSAAVATLAAQPVATSFAEDGVRMVLVPAGCLWVGNYMSVRSSPVFYHCEPAFWMDEVKVSNEQYRQIMQMAPRSRSCADYDWDFCAARPVENITWVEARDYCAARSAQTRLPTELEWEYAARGPLSYLFPWGNDFDPTRIDVRGQLPGVSAAPGVVDSYPSGRSWAGVIGLMGGVNEWTRSLWGAYPYQRDEERVNDDDTNSLRVVRGASFVAESSLDDRLAAYNRDDLSPGTRSYLTGFRCVRDA